jgi:uncharacterized OB-fold protein
VSEYTKPLPRGEHYHVVFYDYCKQHELRFQRCSDCRTWRHMPRESCRHCGSFNWTWERASGTGKIFSWTVIHRALHPGFNDELPYAAVVVELDEGVRVVSQIIDLDIAALRVDLPVQVVFEDVTPDTTLHKFRPA